MKWKGVLALTLSVSAASPLWAAAPSSLYKALGNGMVKDNKTGLVWQQQAQYGTAGYTWNAATSYCKSLNLGGYSSNWRLPTKLELESLIDYGASSPEATIDKLAFPGTPAQGFWTSTPCAGRSDCAWSINFNSGISTDAALTDNRWVRCVR